MTYFCYANAPPRKPMLILPPLENLRFFEAVASPGLIAALGRRAVGLNRTQPRPEARMQSRQRTNDQIFRRKRVHRAWEIEGAVLDDCRITRPGIFPTVISAIAHSA